MGIIAASGYNIRTSGVTETVIYDIDTKNVLASIAGLSSRIEENDNFIYMGHKDSATLNIVNKSNYTYETIVAGTNHDFCIDNDNIYVMTSHTNLRIYNIGTLSVVTDITIPSMPDSRMTQTTTHVVITKGASSTSQMLTINKTTYQQNKPSLSLPAFLYHPHGNDLSNNQIFIGYSDSPYIAVVNATNFTLIRTMGTSYPKTIRVDENFIYVAMEVLRKYNRNTNTLVSTYSLPTSGTRNIFGLTQNNIYLFSSHNGQGLLEIDKTTGTYNEYLKFYPTADVYFVHTTQNYVASVQNSKISMIV